MNLAVTDAAIPAWVFAALAALGTLIPLAFAAPPILRATRISVRRALGSYGASSDHVRPSRLPFAVRGALRRPQRLAFTMLLLVIGGTIVIAAANLERSLAGVSSRLAVARHFDLEIRLLEPIAPDRIAALAAIPGVRAVEAWSVAPAARGEIMHTFPDGGHGGLQLVAPPPDGSAMVTMPVLAGRWLAPGDTDAVVLGNNAGRGVRVGEQIAIAVAGRATTWTVVGIVEEVGGGSAFVTDAAFRTATGITGANLLRFSTGEAADGAHAHARHGHRAPPRGALPLLEDALADTAVYYAMPADLMRSIIDDHVALVTRAILAIAAMLAFVGLIALGSATAINVAERTRELGIMKTIGAGNGRVFRLIAGEALVIGLASAAIAALASVPLTAFAIARIEERGFMAAPPFTLSVAALVLWPLAMAAGSVLAAALPARRAMRLSVREALSVV
jgi:putative ABC transport system permease protein